MACWNTAAWGCTHCRWIIHTCTSFQTSAGSWLLGISIQHAETLEAYNMVAAASLRSWPGNSPGLLTASSSAAGSALQATIVLLWVRCSKATSRL